MQWKQEMRIYLGVGSGIELSTAGQFFNQSLLTGAGPVIVTVATPALRATQRSIVAPVPPLAPVPDSNETDLAHRLEPLLG